MKFQNLSLNFFLNGPTHARTSGNQYAPHFFKVGDIKSSGMILSFKTDRPWQTVQNQIKLLLLEPDHGINYLPIPLHPLEAFLYGKTSFLNSRLQQMFNVSENYGRKICLISLGPGCLKLKMSLVKVSLKF